MTNGGRIGRVAWIGALAIITCGTVSAQSIWPLQQLWQERCMPPRTHQPLSPRTDITPVANLGTGSALLRPCSVTHAVDFGQRYVEIAFSKTTFAAGTWTGVVTWPDDDHMVPPGWYMLVAVDDEGVPSTGKWMRII